MGHYKIKNITDKLPKRDFRKDSVLSVDYNDGFINKVYNLNSGEEILISCSNIPTNIHLLRMKSLVTVIEISENMYYDSKKNTPESVSDNLTKKIIPTKPSKKDEVEKKTINKIEIQEKTQTKNMKEIISTSNIDDIEEK
jgi:hypothetical protein